MKHPPGMYKIRSTTLAPKQDKICLWWCEFAIGLGGENRVHWLQSQHIQPALRQSNTKRYASGNGGLWKINNIWR